MRYEINKGGILFVERPDWVSWDEIQVCQKRAHEVNHNKGVNMLCSYMTGEDLKDAIGDGICFVALYGGSRVVGTCSVKYMLIDKWYHKGWCAYICFGAVDPNYKGNGVYNELQKLIIQRITNDGIFFAYLNTHERNYLVQRVYLKAGFKLLQYQNTLGGADYYSVILGKWLRKCPFSDSRIKIMYHLSKIIVKILWKPGRVSRFSFNNKKK